MTTPNLIFSRWIMVPVTHLNGKLIGKKCLTLHCENMEAAIIKVSSKGQIVIPAGWRKRLGIEEGEELLAVGEGDVLMIKKIERSSLKKEFHDTIGPLREKINKLGLTKEYLDDAIAEARES